MLLFQLKLFLLRISCGSGVIRAPTVALSVVGTLMLHSPTVTVADAFLMSLAAESSLSVHSTAKKWRPEALRCQRFLLSGHPF